MRNRCEITNSSEYFEDSEILKEGQRRLNIAMGLKRPFFLAVGFREWAPARLQIFACFNIHFSQPKLYIWCFMLLVADKPHTPYRAPSRFFDLYPPASEIAIAKDSVRVSLHQQLLSADKALCFTIHSVSVGTLHRGFLPTKD